MVRQSTQTQKERQRDLRLRKLYGITLQEYTSILELQGGKCFICRRPPGRTALAVDHKHVKNDKKHRGDECRSRVRGLLCYRCNSGLQKFKDDMFLCAAASGYLANPPAKQVLVQ